MNVFLEAHLRTEANGCFGSVPAPEFTRNTVIGAAGVARKAVAHMAVS